MNIFQRIKKILKLKSDDNNKSATKKSSAQQENKTTHMNFTYLDELIHNGQKEIKLDYDIILEDEEEEKYPEGIKIDLNNIILDGMGHTIDARCKVRIFRCDGKNIIIKNIILKKGNTNGKGGAIYNSGMLTIMESTLSNNSIQRPSLFGGGGAIYNTGELNIKDSILSDNITKGDGGVINNIGQLSIIGSTLSDNIAQGFGGAIYNWNRGKLSISSSILSNNIARVGFGAIFSSNKVDVVDCSLINNSQSFDFIENYNNM